MIDRTPAVALAAVLGVLSSCTEPNPYLDQQTSDGMSTTTGAGETASTTSMTGMDVGPSSSGGGTGGGTAAPGCVEQGHQCVDAAPPQWMGPLAWAQRPNDGPPLGCVEPYAEVAVEAFTDIVAPSATCECECGLLFIPECGDATVTYHRTASCADEGSDTVALSPGCNDVGTWPIEGSFTYQASTVAQGQCAPLESKQTEEAGFITAHLACGGALERSDCGEQQICAPAPVDPFAPGLCIARPGQHPCPESSVYSESRVVFGALDDSRGCSPCSCELPDQPCLGQSAQLATTSGCTGNSAGSVPADGCTNGVGNIDVMGVLFDPGEPTGDPCTPVAVIPTGAAEGAQPVTLCCVP
ncbi:MAG: hypothetical protein K0V04_21685 [Deltaproteobacteria bacterium]|nr:hypothetical protein [Deltaproteobacteria bacterium]